MTDSGTFGSSKPRLGIYGLTYEYAGRVVLDDISLELGAGEILSLLGPNGSGKSTLMKAVAGILPLPARGCSGQVHYQGSDLVGASLSWRAQRVTYVGSDISAQFPMTASEAVMLGRSCRGGSGATGYGGGGAGFFRFSTAEDRAAVEDAMNRCFCWGLRDRDLHTLSGGEKQLIALARALVQGAKVLFLDESLSRMDLNHQGAVGKLLTELARQGYSVILVSHDINIASEWAHTALLLRGGRRVAHGPIREVLTESNLRALYPHSELVVGTSPRSGAPKVFF